MIKYDLPAAFLYINQVTNKKINYIGHSQGSMIMLGALSERNQVVVSLLSSFSGIGPGSYLSHMDSLAFKVLASRTFIRLMYLLDAK